MRGLRLGNVLLAARSEYIKWLVSPRLILFAVVFLPLHDTLVSPLLRASERMGSPLNALEPCIVAVNSWMGLLLLGIVYIIMMSPFPTVDGNMRFYIFRMGKRDWILGEMLFQVLAAVTYSLATAAVMAAQALGRSFLANGWSLVVTDFDEQYGVEWGSRIEEILPPNLFFQIPPFRAFLFSYGLFTLFLLLCGMAFVVGCLYQKRLLLFVLQPLHIAVGCILAVVSGTGMWLFPVTHAFLASHYRRYYREYAFPPGLSVILLLAAWLLLAFAMYRKAHRVGLDMIGGEVLK